MAWYHLILDMYGCRRREALEDEGLLLGAFQRLVQMMGMKVIGGPLIVRYVGEEGSPSGQGLSGFIIVAESHISIHTDITTGYVSADIYSCKEFDEEGVERLLVELFEPEEVERRFLVRGSRRAERAPGVEAGRA